MSWYGTAEDSTPARHDMDLAENRQVRLIAPSTAEDDQQEQLQEGIERQRKALEQMMTSRQSIDATLQTLNAEMGELKDTMQAAWGQLSSATSMPGSSKLEVKEPFSEDIPADDEHFSEEAVANAGNRGPELRKPCRRLSLNIVEEAVANARTKFLIRNRKGPVDTACCGYGAQLTNLFRSLLPERSEALTAKSVLHSPLFEGVTGVIILINGAVMGTEINLAATADPFKKPPALIACSWICIFYFYFELGLRCAAEKTEFPRGPNVYWNLLDTFLCMLGFLEQIEDATGTSGLGTEAGLRNLKMLYIFRLVRVFRISGNLANLAIMILESWYTLLWTVISLALIVYLYAVALTSLSTLYLKEKCDTTHTDWFQHLLINKTTGEPPTTASNEWQQQQETIYIIAFNFGTLPRTGHTLLQTMLGGIDWGGASQALVDANMILSVIIYLSYIAFVSLAVMNIVTGVFLDTALESARTHRDYVISKQKALRDASLNEMKMFFAAIDVDESDKISKDELLFMMQDESIQAFFGILGFDSTDADRLFKMLDVDGSGDITFDDFVHGCTHLKGPAKAIDLHDTRLAIRRLSQRLDCLTERI